MEAALATSSRTTILTHSVLVWARPNQLLLRNGLTPIESSRSRLNFSSPPLRYSLERLGL
jgi:hypothetical protein